MSIEEDIKQVEMRLPEFKERLIEDVQKVLNEMDELHRFLKIWEDAIGKKNIKNIQIKEKK